MTGVWLYKDIILFKDNLDLIEIINNERIKMKYFEVISKPKLKKAFKVTLEMFKEFMDRSWFLEKDNLDEVIEIKAYDIKRILETIDDIRNKDLVGYVVREEGKYKFYSEVSFDLKYEIKK